jgi:hypothetical protein
MIMSVSRCTSDPNNPKGIFTATQGIGCETVPSLFHFPVVKTGSFQDGFPYTLPQVAGIDHRSGWRTEKEISHIQFSH